ncbi:MAG: hypothetical protein LBT59_25370, partial [Clostridiales bacterium]|nr:hypothetical protein [Clostridiales bacterium]
KFALLYAYPKIPQGRRKSHAMLLQCLLGLLRANLRCFSKPYYKFWDMLFAVRASFFMIYLFHP